MADLKDRHGVAIKLRDLANMCEREIAYRKRVYPRLIEQGRMGQTTADRQIDLMIAASAHFKELSDAEDAASRLI